MAFEARRAAAGGETVGGKFFKGGQFIGVRYQQLEAGLDVKKIERKANRGIFESIRHALFSIRKTAFESIERSPDPSLPGEPPHTRGRGRKSLKRAIFVAADKFSGIVGPRASWVDDVANVLEFGGTRGEETIEERPFMYPALSQNVDRFATGFRGSIGE